MKTNFTKNAYCIRKIFLNIFLILLFNSSSKYCTASHVVGSEVSYQCTATPGVYQVTMKMFRDCSGIQLCSNCPTSLSPSCAIPINIVGAGGSCTGVSFGSQSITVVIAMSGFDVVQLSLCANSTSICTNCGTRTPGTFSPGMEVYTFQGNINLTALPANCCLVSLGFNTCCRNAAITTLASPNNLNFYTEAIINRCATPCNSSPSFTNDPAVVVCAGQDFSYNLGAIDPDGDSLSYAFGPSLTGPGVSAPYVSPYSPTVPLPYLGAPAQSPPALPPLGISIDATTGDIRFRPMGNFVAMLVIEVKQWKLIGGVYTLMGITRRDIQFYSQFCPTNRSPILRTYDAFGVSTSPQPLYTYYICAGQQLCLFVSAWDETAAWDTTDLSWNSPFPLVSNGATFVKAYIAANRPVVGPKKDSMKFCWTPPTSTAKNLPWYFVVTAKDRACSVPARAAHSFAIYVRKNPLAIINRFRKSCNTYDFKYTLYNGSQFSINSAYTQFQIENAPGSGIYSVYNADSVNNQFFSSPGLYHIKLRLAFLPPPNPIGCPNDNILDSIYIPIPVKVYVRDSSTCFGTALNIKASGHDGSTFSGNSYRYTFYSGAMNSNNIIRAFSADSNCTINPLVSGSNNNYKVVIQDAGGCNDSVAFSIFARNLPAKELPSSVRYCYAIRDTLNAGNSNGTVNFWRWNKSPVLPVITDSVSQKIIPQDSGRYVVRKMDSFGCNRFDTSFVFVNAKVPVSADIDKNVCFSSLPLTIVASGTTASIDSFQWRQVPVMDPNLVLSHSSMLSVSPADKAIYQVTGFITYGGTNCSNVDTVVVTVSPQLYSSIVKRDANCYGDNFGFAKVSISGGIKPYQFTWKNSAGTLISNLDSVANLKAGMYRVSVLDSFSCGINDSVFINQPLQTINPGICAVTVDTAIGKNVLIWEKSNVVRAIKFNIYRETNVIGQFVLLGNLGASQFSSYVDTASMPNIKNENYKISVVDSCNLESGLSQLHKSIYLWSTVGALNEVHLNWNLYLGNSFTKQSVMRNVNGGPFTEISQLPATTSTYTDSFPPSGMKNYRIEVALSNFCVATPPSTQIAIIGSNRITVYATGIGNVNANPALRIFPNPSYDKVFIEGANTTKIELYDLLGQQVREVRDKSFIVVGDLAIGIYILKLYDNDRLILTHYKIQKN